METHETMRVEAFRRVRVNETGFEQVSLSPPAAGEHLVRIHYAAVNPLDLQILRGEMGDPGRRLTLGAEAVGMLDGQPVLVAGGGLGVVRDGTYAAGVLAPESSIHRLPEDADLARAATVGVAGKTAWRAVHQLARVNDDDVVLVLGASGGVGTFAVQFAEAAGSRVLAHTATPAKAARLEELGATAIVAANPEALAAAVSEAGVSAVFDPLGGSYLAKLLPVLRAGARAVTYGVLAGREATVNLATLYGKGISIIGTSGATATPQESAEALRNSLDAVLSGRVSVEVEVLPLAEAPTAFDRLRSRTVSGKLLLAP